MMNRMMNLMKAKHLIRIGCLAAFMLFSSQTYAGMENEENNPPEKTTLYEVPKKNIAPQESEKKSQVKEKGSLFAPPPDGGEAVGEDSPVNGQEVAFFLLAVSAYALWTLRKTKPEQKTI